MSLSLDTPLPGGALCNDPAGAFAPILEESGGHWWHGQEDRFQIDRANGAISAWTPEAGDLVAYPTPPSEGHGQIGHAGDLTGLQCRDQTHCGVGVDGALRDAGTLTAAIRWYAPPGAEPRTLMTVNTAVHAKGNSGNYLFLSADGATLTLKDDANSATVSVPLPKADAPQTALLSLGGRHLALQVLGGARDEAQAGAPILSGTASLFIGCRDQRPRLLKKLGAALILDTWLWPGRALLQSDAPEDRRLVTELARYRLWSEDET
ncbi:hypothetical protein roselon_02056 [Roseibacterium elongatum DSM 19469]|uniref:Uncharacterized protein n=1 Tax=Roseicyclus elongatus DSM 19469 TaxID=1294273 RepID=W8S2K8_9RHOB|nr:hypothetical protein [Roseibacterium elongatum]AHM04407.1 hypothetical protein roselon_02056 [Roseibacterium elongatum DSM 19469]